MKKKKCCAQALAKWKSRLHLREEHRQLTVDCIDIVVYNDSISWHVFTYLPGHYCPLGDTKHPSNREIPCVAGTYNDLEKVGALLVGYVAFNRTLDHLSVNYSLMILSLHTLSSHS